jgi:hypothetical protein
MLKHIHLLLFSTVILFVAGCKEDSTTAVTSPPTAKDPNTAAMVSIDRFSSTAGHLQVRDSVNGLPKANEAVNFDKEPFITRGIGPNGESVSYYNFDVQSSTPAPIYVLFFEGDSSPVPNQLNIVNVIPGDIGYNDFWQVQKVTVPKSYVANTITSLGEITAANYKIESQPSIVNCPIVPNGSTAVKRIGTGSKGLFKGWYNGKIVTYFTFEEKALVASGGLVPLSPIYVTFKINPNLAGGGPPSGFLTEPGSTKTHNVPATLPSSATYSPLWTVNIYDNVQFQSVTNLATAKAATVLVAGAAKVNCPIVEIQ